MILLWWQRLHMILTFTTITMWLFHPLGSWRKYCLDTIPTLPMAVGEFPTKYRILWHQTVSFRECSSTLASFFYCKGGRQPGGRRTWSCIGWFFLWERSTWLAALGLWRYLGGCSLTQRVKGVRSWHTWKIQWICIERRNIYIYISYIWIRQSCI